MILGRACRMLAIVALTATAATPPPAPAPRVSQADRASCQARGGRIVRGGLLGLEGCVIRYKDAGKVCADRRQCAGACEFRGGGVTPRVGAPVAGRCSIDNSPFGCRAFVEHGRLQEAVCTD